MSWILTLMLLVCFAVALRKSKEVMDLKKGNDGLVSDITKQNHVIKERDEEISNLKIRIDNIKKNIDNIEIRHETQTNAHISTIKQYETSLSNTIIEHNKTIENKNLEIKDLITINKEHQESIKRYEKSLDDANNLLNDDTKLIEELRNKIRSYENQPVAKEEVKVKRTRKKKE